jgi:hypothetical protein
MRTLIPLLLMLSQTIAAQTGLPRAESRTFTERMEYYIRDGGEWTSKNDDYTPDNQQAQSYTRKVWIG